MFEQLQKLRAKHARQPAAVHRLTNLLDQDLHQVFLVFELPDATILSVNVFEKPFRLEDEQLDAVLPSYFLRVFTLVPIGFGAKLVGREAAADEGAQGFNRSQLPGVRERASEDIGLALGLDAPEVSGPGFRHKPGAIVTQDNEPVGLVGLEVDHAVMLLARRVRVDDDEVGAVHAATNGEHNRLLRVDGPEQHLADGSAAHEAQRQDLTVPHAIDTLVRGELVVTGIDFRVGALGLEIGAEFGRHWQSPTQWLIELRTSQRRKEQTQSDPYLF